jgi:hypothetical protein
MQAPDIFRGSCEATAGAARGDAILPGRRRGWVDLGVPARQGMA